MNGLEEQSTLRSVVAFLMFGVAVLFFCETNLV